jgi:hypothetical protein
MFFEDDYDIYDELTVLMEVGDCLKTVQKWKTEKLVDEVVLLQQYHDFMQYTDKVIEKYWRDGDISKDERRILEGAFVIVNTYLAICDEEENSEDKIQMMVKKK